jgi:hypothetical protein
MTLSARTGSGMGAWLDWLRVEVNAQRLRAASAQPQLHTAGAALLVAQPPD